MKLTDDQMTRYNRNIIIGNIGELGQIKLLQSKILVIGAGGLGSPVIYYLSAAGVGNIGVVDKDKVDLSNLQRQIIHTSSDIGKEKTLSAKEKINKLNKDINIIPINLEITKGNILSIIKEYDFIIDCTDNFESKFLINDASVILKKPFSHGGVSQYNGQTMTYIPDHTCYRCVFKEPPAKGVFPPGNESGILGAVAGILGTIQSAEAIRYILGIGDLLVDRMLTFNALDMNFREAVFIKNIKCDVCGKHPIITELQ